MTIAEQLDAVYATLPKINCQRKCQEFCGPLLIPKVEYHRIAEAGFVFPTRSMNDVELNPAWSWLGKENLIATEPRISKDCHALKFFSGTCGIYPDRPLVCRLWGMVDADGMRCPYGCLPDRWLTRADAYIVMEKILAIQKGSP